MYDSAVQNLIDELSRLPGVGPKSAQRIAFYILNSETADMHRLAKAITTVKSTVSFCTLCGNISATELCAICRDESRDDSMICVVEEPKDVVAIERTHSFTGRYHVLGGAINPLAGLGPEQLRIRELVTRLADERIQEIILAMDPNLEGEATATYLSRMLVPLGMRLSRLASGLPVGGDLEYADEITLGRALEGRRVISEGAGVEQASAAEDFERVTQAEEAERARTEQQRPDTPRKRWSSSMFDDIDADEKSSPENNTSRAGEQSSINEALVERVLEEAEGADAAGGGGADAAPAEGDRPPADTAERVPVETSAAYRVDDYAERIRQLQDTPLRTAAPRVPPLPGTRYANPWE